jgi:UDP-N-acetylmuramate--alanine ligase
MRNHVIGVGGAGMSAIAIVLAGMGHHVTGSDRSDSAMIDRLSGMGIGVGVGSDVRRVAGVDVVTHSTAVPASDEELAGARSGGVMTLTRSEVLAAICATRRTLAVAGTHGKTTTSSMLALILAEAGLDPSFIIGGEVTQLRTGARWSDGDWLVVEADESDGTFLDLERVGAIVTNVEPDHLEHYGGFDGLRDAFDRFVVRTPGPVVVCIDDPLSAELVGRVAARCDQLVTFGTSRDADYRMTEISQDGYGVSWVVEAPDSGRLDLTLGVPGLHNARNAMAAAALALEVGADPAAIREALAGYRGVGRRFEFRGEAAGVTFVDDYAHLPTEVAAAIAAATSGRWGRVIGVFQPHRYSRTEALWSSFGDAFTGVDELIVCDIFSSGEPERPGVTGHLIVDAVRAADPGTDVVWRAGRDELRAYLVAELRSGDLCLTLGAGDLTTLPDELIEFLGRDNGARA